MSVDPDGGELVRRRIETATVLFTDLVDSTAIRSAEGDDRADEVRRAHDHAIRMVVAENDGIEVKHTGDGFMLRFASAANGALAAREMQRSISRLAVSVDLHLSIRVGVSAGDVERDGDDLFGLPVVQAARLCAAAEPGQVLVAEIARTLAGSRGEVEFRLLPAMELKGLEQPLVVYEVRWEDGRTPAPLPGALAVERRTPAVGLGAELGQLRHLWAECERAGRLVVLVAGEPGVGKTRLVSELAREVHNEGGTVLLGRCDDAVPAPLRPVGEIVRHALAHVPERSLQTLSAAQRELLADLVRRVGSASDDQADPLVRIQARHEAVGALLDALAQDAPVLVIFDDLHWADAGTLLLLRYLAFEASSESVLVAGTYRDTDVDRSHPLAEALADLRRTPTTTRILLRGLDRLDTGLLIDAWAGSKQPDTFVDLIHAATEGNPFFVEEVLRHLVETGAIYRSDETGEWRTDRALAELGIPEGVRETVGRRLGRLGAQANEVLACAAVVGREFEVDIVSQATSIPEMQVVEVLEAARHNGLVVEGDEFGVFAFAHALVRATLLDEMVTLRRVRLHQRLGEAIEARTGDELLEHADALAYHFGEAAVAGEWERAIRYHLLAADRAEGLGDPDGLERHLRQALDIQDARGNASPDATLALLERLMWTTSSGREPSSAFAYVDRAVDLGLAIGDPAVVARVIIPLGNNFEYGGPNTELMARTDEILAGLPPGDSAARALIDGMVSSIRSVSVFSFEEWADNLRAAESADAMAHRLDDRAARGFGAVAVHNSLWSRWEPERALAISDEIRGLAAADAAPAWAGDRRFRWVANGALRAFAPHLQLGRRRECELVLDEAEANPLSRINVWFSGTLPLFRAVFDLADGRFDDARANGELARSRAANFSNIQLGYYAQRWIIRFEEGIIRSAALEGIADQVPFPHVAGLAALVRAEQGDHDQAIAMLDRFMVSPGLGVPWNSGQAPTLRSLAETCAHVGHAHLAAQLRPIMALYAGQLLTAFNGIFIDGAADRALGQLSFAAGDFDEAVKLFESGLALECAFPAPALEARTRYWLARALRARGSASDDHRAHEELSTAAAIASQLGLGGIERLVDAAG